MTEKYELSRRKALAALGTIGAAGAGAGLGTSAFFYDEENFANNQLTAGELDMKIAATHHYVDWLPDTDGPDAPDAPDSPQETEAAEMSDDPNFTLEGDDDDPDIELEVTDGDELASGSVVKTINGGAGADIVCDGEQDAEGPAIIDLGDVKPGDFGAARFCFKLCDNPGYVWANSSLVEELTGEGDVTEPESDDPDEETGVVELLDVVQVAFVPTDIAGNLEGLEVAAEDSMTLREYLNEGETRLEGDIDAEEGGGVGGTCFEGETEHCVTLVWWVPPNGFNEIQDDRAGFDIKFRTEQCRHNSVGNNETPNPTPDPDPGGE